MVSQQRLEVECARLRERFEENPGGRVFAPLSDVLRKLGQTDEALRVCQTGLARHPEYSSAHVILGKIHLERGDEEAAAAAFREVLELDDENLLALRHLARLHEADGELDEALRLWHRVARIEPDSDAVEEQIATLERRRQAEPEEEPPDEPPDEPNPASGQASSAEIATITLAQIYYEQGFLAKALEVYEQIHARNPGLEGLAERVEAIRKEVAAQSVPRSASPAEADLDDLAPDREEPIARETTARSHDDESTRRDADAEISVEIEPEEPMTRRMEAASEKERFENFRRWLDGISADDPDHSQ